MILDLTDFVRRLFPRMPNNIWQNRSDELASQIKPDNNFWPRPTFCTRVYYLDNLWFDWFFQKIISKNILQNQSDEQPTLPRYSLNDLRFDWFCQKSGSGGKKTSQKKASQKKISQKKASVDKKVSHEF